eukprot:gnl/TRDRNA2_/TRDRNA2_82270_c0_seq1.p1 gnl/TRDRNA2_/TRDRNA2_82270_c0~~gnl/TRDRNA2_/TRDRNA2_82270_c0_seq1.p1  ORF type:complete len:386 (-),score=51.30 gnl/TRDRNA2_/TRDRNA2_82270_c0_seq1:63-1178(-)
MAGNRNLLIRNLPDGFTDEDCANLFGAFGTITQCRVAPSDDPAARGTCMALVQFDSVEAAQFVQENMNQKEGTGLPVPPRISFAVNNAPRQPPSTGYGPMGMGKGGGAKGMSPYGGGPSEMGGKGGDQPRNAKTVLCSFFMKGKCGKGPACTFAHGPQELAGGGADMSNGKGFNPQAMLALMQNTQMFQNMMQTAMPNQQMSLADKMRKPGTFKTMMCKFFVAEGACQRGSECTYAHSESELAEGISQVDPTAVRGYKMKICKFFEMTGDCGRGAACTYAHGEAELRTREMGHMGLSGRMQQAQPGDWYCPNCGDLVFARKAACGLCGAAKPANAGAVPGAPPAPNAAVAPPTGEKTLEQQLMEFKNTLGW